MTQNEKIFSTYQKFVIAVLAIIQFTIILDFMVISPLGAILMDKLSITPSKFGVVVSVYAFSAGISGLFAAGFADKYDRKKLLLFFYSGFTLGTFLCGIAPDYNSLLVGRIVTGLFGGVLSSISFAIVTDLFKMHVRGRVMGFIQMAFAVSQVAGIPVGIYLANDFGWHSPFIMIVVLCLLTAFVIFKWMKPVNEHLQIKNETHPFRHLKNTLSNPQYVKAFFATALLAIGGFMLMPFSSTFLVNNINISLDHLPIIFALVGISSLIFMPIIGKVADKIGKYKVFTIGSLLSIAMVIVYTNLYHVPLWIVIAVNIVLFTGIMSRMIPLMALMTAIPEMKDRGAFMGINSSIQQISGGIASVLAGMIVFQETPTSPLHNFDLLGYITSILMIVTLVQMYFINKTVERKTAETAAV